MTASRFWILILSGMTLAGQAPDRPTQNAGLQIDDNDPALPGLVCRSAMFAQQSGDLPGAEKLIRHGLTLFVRNNSLETTAERPA